MMEVKLRTFLSGSRLEWINKDVSFTEWILNSEIYTTIDTYGGKKSQPTCSLLKHTFSELPFSLLTFFTFLTFLTIHSRLTTKTCRFEKNTPPSISVHPPKSKPFFIKLPCLD